MYSISKAAERLGISSKTLRRWESNGKVKCDRTLGGHRRFPIQEISRFYEEKTTASKSMFNRELTCAIYGRVSSHKQSKRGDLERQIPALKDPARNNKIKIYKIYKDVASGLNANRKGLWRMIEDAKEHEFSMLLIKFKDRLTRFGHDYLENYFQQKIKGISNYSKEISLE